MLAIKTKWKKNYLTAHINTYTLRFESKKNRKNNIKKNYKSKMRIKNISKPRKRKKRQ